MEIKDLKVEDIEKGILKTGEIAKEVQAVTDVLPLPHRIAAPLPKFFKRVRNIGLVLAAISGAILTAPVALPAIVVTAAGYLAVGGTIAGVVSQLTRETE